MFFFFFVMIIFLSAQTHQAPEPSAFSVAGLQAPCPGSLSLLLAGQQNQPCQNPFWSSQGSIPPSWEFFSPQGGTSQPGAAGGQGQWGPGPCPPLLVPQQDLLPPQGPHCPDPRPQGPPCLTKAPAVPLQLCSTSPPVSRALPAWALPCSGLGSVGIFPSQSGTRYSSGVPGPRHSPVYPQAGPSCCFSSFPHHTHRTACSCSCNLLPHGGLPSPGIRLQSFYFFFFFKSILFIDQLFLFSCPSTISSVLFVPTPPPQLPQFPDH